MSAPAAAAAAPAAAAAVHEDELVDYDDETNAQALEPEKKAQKPKEVTR